MPHPFSLNFQTHLKSDLSNLSSVTPLRKKSRQKVNEWTQKQTYVRFTLPRNKMKNQSKY